MEDGTRPGLGIQAGPKNIRGRNGRAARAAAWSPGEVSAPDTGRIAGPEPENQDRHSTGLPAGRTERRGLSEVWTPEKSAENAGCDGSGCRLDGPVSQCFGELPAECRPAGRRHPHRLLAEVARYSLRRSPTDSFLGQCLGAIGRHLDAGCVTLLEGGLEGGAEGISAVWTAPDATPRTRVSLSAPGLLSCFSGGEPRPGEILRWNAGDEQQDTGPGRYFQDRGTASLLAAPLHGPDGLLGLLVLEECRRPRPWLDEEVDLIGILADILAGGIIRRRAEESLRRSETQLRAALDSLPFDFFLFDSTGRFQVQNLVNRRKWGDLSGKLPEDGLCGLVPEEVRSHWSDGKDSALAGETLRREVTWRRKGGLSTHYTIAAPIRAGGDILGVLGMDMDITERKEAEDALRESGERLELALAGAELGLWDRQIDTGTLVFNKRWAEMLGYAPEEIEPHFRGWQRLVHPDDLDAVMTQLDAHLQGKCPFYETEYRLRTKSGEWKWILSRGKVVKRDPDGRPLRFTGTHLDITGRRQAEEERAAMEERLREAQRLESVGRLAGGIAHDFNNLLAPIIGYAELGMLKLSTQDPVYGNFSRILDAGQRARDLTRQLLAFGRRQVLEMKTLNLAEEVARFEPTLRRLLPENIDIRVQGTEEDFRVMADPAQIQQVLVNLATRAQEAMPDGGTLTISTGGGRVEEAFFRPEVPVTGPYVTLTVRDTGPAMDPSAIRTIFEPFSSRNPGVRGKGLGLATVYGIVKQHNGSVTVSSEPGAGTAFAIHLPCTDGIVQDENRDEAGRDENAGREIVMIVEDEDTVRKLTRDILAEQGYHLMEARGAGEAIRIAREHQGPIHLLVTDVVMPDMNGRELYGHLAPDRPEMKVLFMSGYTGNIIARHGVLEPGIEFIQKPFSVNALARKVRQVLCGRGPESATG